MVHSRVDCERSNDNLQVLLPVVKASITSCMRNNHIHDGYHIKLHTGAVRPPKPIGGVVVESSGTVVCGGG